jgi:hypothetical protein
VVLTAYILLEQASGRLGQGFDPPPSGWSSAYCVGEATLVVSIRRMVS